MADHNTNQPTGQPFKIDLDSEPSLPPKAQPQGDFMAGFKEAPATPMIMAANFMVFGLMAASTGGAAFMSPSTETLITWGADYAPLTLSGICVRLRAVASIRTDAKWFGQYSRGTAKEGDPAR